MASHLNWPEGYLNLEKSRIVSNKTLAKSALDIGLDKYIITKPFTGNKWRPSYVSEVLTTGIVQREMSSKTLADVMEALIGAAFVDGGLAKAFTCIETLLPGENWSPQHTCIDRLLAESIGGKNVELALLEKVVGHHFNHSALLLEATTHASFPYNKTGLSYERLEFLGDAVLDLIIVPKLHTHPRTLKHWELHRVHEALVNGNFLGYCCMMYAVIQERLDVKEDDQDGGNELAVKSSERQVHLHDFLRADGRVLRAKREALENYHTYQHDISQALEHSTEYPWPDLLAMRPPKFFSDIVESILGALFLDSGGDLAVCEAFIDGLGILKHMHRFLDNNVETAFPKEQLGILSDRDKVEYTVNQVEAEDGSKSFSCVVKIAGTEVAEVSSCANKEEAEARAARKAVRVLETKTGASSRKRKLDVGMRDKRMIDKNKNEDMDDDTE